MSENHVQRVLVVLAFLLIALAAIFSPVLDKAVPLAQADYALAEPQARHRHGRRDEPALRDQSPAWNRKPAADPTTWRKRS